jgi:tetratricopeptide (TPR) repeat protein
MYKNIISASFISLVFNILFVSFANAECSGNECNLERESKGMWYGDVNLIGSVNRDGFIKKPFSTWFVTGYESYQPDQKIIDQIKKSALIEGNNLNVTVFMGTWCSDSQKQIPRLYKILDEIGLSSDRVSVHALGIVPHEFRKTHDGIAENDLNIYRVPTIILRKNNIELGRIIETPAETLEQDLLTILQGGSYRPPAHILEGEVNQYLEKNGVEGFEKNIDSIADFFREKGIKEDDLNHYIAFNLLYAKRYKEAAAVLKMMLKIFPEAGHLHLTLARTHELLNNDYRALKSYRRAFHYIDADGKMLLIRDALNRSAEFK